MYISGSSSNVASSDYSSGYSYQTNSAVDSSFPFPVQTVAVGGTIIIIIVMVCSVEDRQWISQRGDHSRRTAVRIYFQPEDNFSALTKCWLVEWCFTSTTTVGLLETGAQDDHLGFHTAPELWHKMITSLARINNSATRAARKTRYNQIVFLDHQMAD